MATSYDQGITFAQIRIRQAAYRAQLVPKTSAYTARITDTIIQADAAGGAFAITLPIMPRDTRITVQRVNSGANAVTVAAVSGNINGAASISLGSQWAAGEFWSDGSAWFRTGS